MTETPSHTVLTVRPADHEAGDPAREAWRAKHADETLSTAGAYFEVYEDDRTPARSPDGTYRVHVVAPSNLGIARRMLTEHEGMTIVSEDQEPGLGILVTR